MKKIIIPITLFLVPALAFAQNKKGPRTLFNPIFPTKVDEAPYAALKQAALLTATDRGANKLGLPKARGLGAYLAQVSENLKQFTDQAYDGYSQSIASAPTLTDKQKRLIAKRSSKQRQGLKNAYSALNAAAAELASGGRDRAGLESLVDDLEIPGQGVQSGKRRKKRNQCKVKFKFFRDPLNGRAPKTEEQAQAISLLASFDNYLIQFLADTEGNSLINQLKTTASSSQGAYLERLRSRLSKVLNSDANSVQKLALCGFGNMFKNVNSEPILLTDVIPNGTTGFALAGLNVTSGQSETNSGGLILDTDTSTARLALASVNDGAFRADATFIPKTSDTSPPMIQIKNGTTLLDSEFADMADLDRRTSFDKDVTLSDDSFIKDDSASGETSVEILPGMTVEGSLKIDNKGAINGNADLSQLPFPITGELKGVLNKSTGGVSLYQILDIMPSLGTGGQIVKKFDLTKESSQSTRLPD